jgi:hypothetical protein
MKLEFSRPIFWKKNFKYQVSSKFVQWESTCSMLMNGQTEGHDEANERFSQFCERA